MLDLTIFSTTFLTTFLSAARRAATPVVTVALGATLLVGCSRDADDPSPGAQDTPATGSPAANSPAPTSSGPDDEGSAEDGSTDGDSPAPDLTPEEVTEVEKGTEDYYDDNTDALGEPKETPKPSDYPHVTGDALEGLFNEVTEFRDNGWRMVGKPEVVRQRVVRRTTGPDTVVVRACIDNSAVRVQDRFGDEVPNSRPSSPRTLNVLTLVRKSGGWVVTDQRLAAKPDC